MCINIAYFCVVQFNAVVHSKKMPLLHKASKIFPTVVNCESFKNFSG